MMMLSDDQVIADDVVDLELMGRSLHTLELLRVDEEKPFDHHHRCVQRLNLHCNLLTSLKGLPPWLHLTEINVSSNCFTTCNLPELGHLPQLQSLDLSGNKIDSLRPLPFMPSLRRLSVAFNFICSLEGLHDSTPHLVYLDVRGYLISRRSEILDPVQRLTALQSLLLGGTQPNPICKNNSSAIILELFHSSSSLSSIDKKSRDEWGSIQSQSPLPTVAAAATATAGVSTPHFDKILHKFRAGKTRQTKQLFLSPPVRTNRLPPSQLSSPHRTHHLPSYNVRYAADPASLLVPHYSSSSTGANTKARSRREDQGNDRPHHDGRGGGGYQSRSPTHHHSSSSHALDPFPSSSSSTTDGYELDEEEEHLLSPHHHHQQLLKLQYVLLVCAQREEKARVLRLANSFMQWKLFSNIQCRLIMEGGAADALAQDIVMSSLYDQQQQQQQSREFSDLWRAKEDDAVLHKQQYDRLYSKYLQQDTALAALRREMETQADEQAYQMSALRTENLRLGNDLRLEQGRLAGLASQHELAEAQHERTLQSALWEGAARIKELEALHAGGVSERETMQAELSYSKLRLAEGDATAAQLRNACSSLQSELISLQSQLQSATTSLKFAQDDLQSKSDLIDKLQREQTSSSSIVDSTLHVFQDQLSAVNSQLDAFRKQEQLLNEAKERLEVRLKKLQSAFEGLSANHSQLQQDYDDLTVSRSRDVLTIKELGKCVKRLQHVLQQRQQQQQKTDCKKCADTDKQLSDAGKRCIELQEDCSRKAEEMKEWEAKHRRVERLHSEAVDRIDRMQRDITKLELQVHTTDNSNKQLQVSNQQREQVIKKLETSVKVKEAMLEDQSTELFDLRSKLQHELTQFKRCKRDYDDVVDALNGRLREKEAAVSGLESELLKKSHTELKLKELIKEYQRTDRSVLAKQDEDEDDDEEGDETAADDSGFSVSFDFMGTPTDSPELLKNRSKLQLQQQQVPCSSKQCRKEKDQLMRDVKGKYLQLMELKKENDRLSALKLEEASKFNAALTKLERNSVELADGIKNEKEKFEASIAKYRSEVKRYKRSCHQLEEQLRGKESELVAREQEMQRAKAASDQLSNAIINFQRVAIRCRPFTIDDKLGVKMIQNAEEDGEVELINCDYSTKRFPFTYSWWSAYGYKRHCNANNMPDAEAMLLVNQEMVYNGCGTKIKNDLLSGSAVVLFAYGLSGSGKTYTVFGPDAADAPEAWFKHASPQPLWGIFPRLAYDLFNERKDGWKISMKYFQNVVDTVRDLMSPNAEEQHYKNGMRKDPDGFMDIEWCDTKVLHSWNDLRETFQRCNARKAIAPTQFNPMSTRGHCIMVLEVEMPHPDNPAMKQRGRVYVCDLAGTEPAGDIFYANYQRILLDDGTLEYKLLGPNQDNNKTKELQEQGKKINLSLSEMAQFFMKMAEAVMKKKLKPGDTIPGCNSFFLCKYLKDTMLQARTYLFCAIRPEVTYLKYTFATLGFAKNASVVRLAPKKATVAASAAERKLMAELETMKALVASLQENANTKKGSDDADRMIAELQAKLAEKQSDLVSQMDGDNGASEGRSEQQRQEYAKRGISLADYEKENTCPYFLNLDSDAFRSNRFMYILRKELTVFGSKNDIQLMSLAVIKNHCTAKYDAAGGAVYIIAGKGDTYHNGKLLPENEQVKLALFDRLAVGDQLMQFHWPELEVDNVVNPISAEEAVEEFQEGMIASRSAGARAGTNAADTEAMDVERKKILEEREKWEKEKSEMQSERNMKDYQRAMVSVDNAILDLLPKTKEAKVTVDLLNRTTMSFDVVLEKGSENIPRVKIHVENSDPKLSILIDPQEFLPKLSLLKDEMMKLRSAIDSGRSYTLPERHDPIYLMFDNDFHLGTATHWPEYLLYNLETEDGEVKQDIKNAAVPYNNVGLLEVKWVPLAGPEEADEGKALADIDSEEDLLGKPWTYRLEIRRSADLPVFCAMAYVSYEFFGENFTTEAVEQTTYAPVFEYKKVHHVPNVTKDFMAFLKGSVEMHVHVTQYIEPPKDIVSTDNEIVAESIRTGEPLGYKMLNQNKKKSKLGGSDSEEAPSDDMLRLINALQQAADENDRLAARILELEARLEQYEGPSHLSSSLSEARLLDAVING